MPINSVCIRVLLLIMVSVGTLAASAENGVIDHKGCSPCQEKSACVLEQGYHPRIVKATKVDSLYQCVSSKIDVPIPLMLDGGSVEGNVAVDIELNNNGKLVNAHCVEGLPFAYQAVLESVAKWKFLPVHLPHGFKRIQGTILVHFDFRTHQRPLSENGSHDVSTSLHESGHVDPPKQQ